MRKLKIVYVDRLPRQPEDLPPDVVEVHIGLSRKGVELDIVRNGFLAAENVKHAIQCHIQQLDARSRGSDQPLAVRVGLYPTISQEWRTFLDHLLQQDDSWAFLVPAAGAFSTS